MAEAGLLPNAEPQKLPGMLQNLKTRAEGLRPHVEAAVKLARPLVEEISTTAIRHEEMPGQPEKPFRTALVDGLLLQFAPQIAHLKTVTAEGGMVLPSQWTTAIGADMISTSLAYFGPAVDVIFGTPGMASGLSMEFRRVNTQQLKPFIRTKV